MNVNATKAIRVAKNWDASIVFDVSDELVGASWNDKVNVFFEVKE